MKQIDSLVSRCIKKGYITREQAPWLRYGMEKRIITFFISVPMIFVGLLITSPPTLFLFYISFCSLRTRTNGIHAKSFAGCFIFSILGEIFFLYILTRVWNEGIACILLLVSVASIIILAPFNHPDMNLSSEEIAECALSTKRWLTFLLGLLMLFHMLHFDHCSSGILLGIVMDAVALIFAYIFKGGKNE